MFEFAMNENRYKRDNEGSHKSGKDDVDGRGKKIIEMSDEAGVWGRDWGGQGGLGVDMEIEGGALVCVANGFVNGDRAKKRVGESTRGESGVVIVALGV